MYMTRINNLKFNQKFQVCSRDLSCHRHSNSWLPCHRWREFLQLKYDNFIQAFSTVCCKQNRTSQLWFYPVFAKGINAASSSFLDGYCWSKLGVYHLVCNKQYMYDVWWYVCICYVWWWICMMMYDDLMCTCNIDDVCSHLTTDTIQSRFEITWFVAGQWWLVRCCCCCGGCCCCCCSTWISKHCTQVSTILGWAHSIGTHRGNVIH